MIQTEKHIEMFKLTPKINMIILITSHYHSPFLVYQVQKNPNKLQPWTEKITFFKDHGFFER